MGELLRSIDWSKNPLGPMASWSRELRLTVGLVLPSGFPMLVWWGPKLIQIYNDAFRPVCGAKHPHSFGASGPESWAEIWNVIGSMIEGSYRGNPASWSDDLELLIDRNGFLEEYYFHVSYSPLPDENSPNGMSGVHYTADEITAQLRARQLTLAESPDGSAPLAMRNPPALVFLALPAHGDRGVPHLQRRWKAAYPSLFRTFEFGRSRHLR